MAKDQSAPASGAFAITPSDTVMFGRRCRSIYVGGAGNVSVLTPENDTVTFTAVPVGAVLPVEAVRVNSTSTTATLLIGLV
jgi:hypothetical protein